MVFFIFIKVLKETSLSNSGEPDQMLHFAASDLVLHCLPLFHKEDAKLNLLSRLDFPTLSNGPVHLHFKGCWMVFFISI